MRAFRNPVYFLLLSNLFVFTGCQRDNYFDNMTTNLPENKQLAFAQLIMDRGEPSIVFRFTNDKKVYGVSASYVTTLCSKDVDKPTFVKLPATKVIWQNDKIWLHYSTFELSSTAELHRWQDIISSYKIGAVLYNECRTDKCS